MPLFTAETARRAAILSHAANSARHRPAIPPDPPPPTAQAPQITPQPADDGFHRRRLNRVRDQLDLVDAAIAAECRLQDDAGKPRSPDGQRLNWLASAQERLAEQERILAGRPLPGSMRPTRSRDDRRTSPLTTAEPTLPAAPTPAASPLPPQPPATP